MRRNRLQLDNQTVQTVRLSDSYWNMSKIQIADAVFDDLSEAFQYQKVVFRLFKPAMRKICSFMAQMSKKIKKEIDIKEIQSLKSARLIPCLRKYPLFNKYYYQSNQLHALYEQIQRVSKHLILYITEGRSSIQKLRQNLQNFQNFLMACDFGFYNCSDQFLANSCNAFLRYYRQQTIKIQNIQKCITKIKQSSWMKKSLQITNPQIEDFHHKNVFQMIRLANKLKVLFKIINKNIQSLYRLAEVKCFEFFGNQSENISVNHEF